MIFILNNKQLKKTNLIYTFIQKKKKMKNIKEFYMLYLVSKHKQHINPRKFYTYK